GDPHQPAVVELDDAPRRDRLDESSLDLGHASNTTRPAATVSLTFPLSVCPSSHELTERERKPSSLTRQAASVSSRTRCAGAPTAIRGGSSPKARAGPADIRSSSVESVRSPDS